MSEPQDWKEMAKTLATAHEMLDQREALIRELVYALQMVKNIRDSQGGSISPLVYSALDSAKKMGYGS